MKQFEYREENQLHPTDLRSLGKDGWELVGFSGWIRRDGYSEEKYYIFKREIEEITL